MSHSSYDSHLVTTILRLHGDRFAGSDHAASAREWLGNDFTPSEVDSWCEVGVWNADVAAEFRDAGLSPKQVHEVSEVLRDGSWSFIKNDPIYAVCNGDAPADLIISGAS